MLGMTIHRVAVPEETRCQIVQSVPEKLGTGGIVDLNFPLYIRLLQLHSSSSTQVNQVNTTQTPQSTSACLSPTRTIRDTRHVSIEEINNSQGFLLIPREA